MPSLSIKLFGHPLFAVGDEPIQINRRKGVALVAYLAATGEVQGRETLSTLLWPESDQSRSRAGLRSALYSINNSDMGRWLVADKESIRLNLGSADEVDVALFQRLLAEVDAHQHAVNELCETCLNRLELAVALYSDHFMTGFTLENSPAFDEWQFFQGDALKGGQRRALQLLLAHMHHTTRFEEAIPYAKGLLALDTLDEEAHRNLILSYAQAGQKSAALRQYERCVNLLEKELGVAPEAQTVALYEQVNQGPLGEGAERSDFELGPRVSLGPEKEIPHNLPNSTTPFVGRAGEVARINQFLADPHNRLLTIVGPGGMGKTRLALDVAHTQLTERRFSDGIFFVGLARLEKANGIIPTIADAVGLPLLDDQRSPRQQVFDYLRNKSLLLILDNFEHLLDGAALAAELLRNGPGLHILVTSRERLNLYEEQRYPLEGLDYPDGANPTETAMGASAAVTLFVQRVQQRLPDFTLKAENYAPLLAICRLVEGMPLGLELAATWTDVLTLPEIVTEIEKSFDFLETDVSNVPARHRNIRAVIDNSWQRLSPEEQTVFAKLSIFKGGATSDAAQAVAGGSRKVLIRLVNRSLLRFDREKKRYEIHELLRQYGSEMLGEAEKDPILLAHATFYSRFLAERQPDFRGEGQEKILTEIDLEIENCLLAWRTAVNGKQVRLLDESLNCLGSFLIINGRYSEGESLINTAIKTFYASPSAAGSSPETALKVQLWEWHSRFLRHLRRFEPATAAMQEAVNLLESAKLDDKTYRERRAILLLERARLNSVQKWGGDSENWALESLALFRSLDDSWGIGLCLDLLSLNHLNLGRLEEAEQLAKERLRLQHTFNNRRGIARTYSLLGVIYLHLNRLSEAEDMLHQAKELLQEGQHQVDIILPMVWSCVVYLFEGKFEKAQAAAIECIARCEDLGVPPNENVTVTVGRALINLGRYRDAVPYVERNVERYRQENNRWALAFSLSNLGRIKLAYGETADAISDFKESSDLLRQMNNRTIVAEVLFNYGSALVLKGKYDRAVEALIEGLEVVAATEKITSIRFELPAMALLRLHDGDIEAAVEFYTAGLKSDYISNSIWFEEVIGQRISKAAESLQPDVIEAAKARGEARDFLETVHALLAELKGRGKP